ncbi:carbamoyltransferase [Methylosinus sp. H3A]|uniref:carbamoyltransferase family protein n=1 Tax=Methylosinus sp. H3A TaxID=2785786 RepID=UPI0018C2E106|nr:carbamoyltransferase C-terminal domain-containing protein [Methylosinus sp. H3A]MBG0811733.1 carbamoyltransferase [Methylosinus sp. H3A]
MIVLGINAFHADAAAALIRDGELVAAAEEERFRRIKHWGGFPSQAVRYCLAEAGVDIGAVDIVALNQDGRANLGAKLRYLLGARPSLASVVERARNRRARDGVAQILRREYPDARRLPEIAHVEHHLAHLYSAFHVSPFREASVASIDGFGDFASAAWALGGEGPLETEGRVSFPHSLGVFYQAITQYLGFPHYGDEYKVMGLAPYGAPNYLPQMRLLLCLHGDGSFELALPYFRHHKEKIAFRWDDAPAFADLFTPALEELLGPRRAPSAPLEERHRDIARSAQAMYEEAFFNLLNALHARHGQPNLALAGGCAMNSAANGKIRRMTPYRHVYVQPAAGDAGGALGAAFAVWRRSGGARRFVMDHAYWGPQFATEEIAPLVDAQSERLAEAGCSVERIADQASLCRRAAAIVAEGHVLGWFQGRMEWGARALGNRSIICDPRRADMKDILNAKIKRRESFRPFAPSVLAEAASEWFEEEGDAPFMASVAQIRADKRARVPAVAHVDGTGRLQTVAHSANPRFHALISAFRDITGVPMTLNTSFNENEPVVCRPQEALDCFLRTNMDALALGDMLITRIPRV